ncbi:hypothetical protein [Microbulbifer thermotolerans]|uniref:Uncharacterized protein n=1 Tax=Microbulbifer thermotolerans TaxID=252514 RepID=A0AB35HUM7_MICTH|nr:hypothetical protein [Microbulbifer thermotolerans]MCX2780872.1 hypothetical protein [Microbulbifer thermotolerans]MCX2784274.1 hypothetical protein [Microbulbifer thermotolerans]MCX2794351.1 hypothetical protein [Microbulbifer thermotolerans]MCX2800999.1 hypothetical protein [Microbulbifer thermotolerans]MCX2804837.1 hypothetical protein [Microbulbifer thermotolerans]
MPVEKTDRNDPFFFDPDDSSYSADFAEVGYYQPNTQLPLTASRYCPEAGEIRKVGSACWFFPVIRVY